jgi:hypothetical protein
VTGPAPRVPGRSEIESWTPQQRDEVARTLDEVSGRPDPRTYRGRRGMVLLITGVGALALIPWIVYLNATLPSTVSVRAWRGAWVGFDIGLVAVLACTAWLALRRRQLLTIVLAVAATLLVVDAWFDVSLSWGTSEQAASLMTAGLVELPVAVFLLAVTLTNLRQVIATVAALRGRRDVTVSLWRAPMVMLGSPEGTGSTPHGTDRSPG